MSVLFIGGCSNGVLQDYHGTEIDIDTQIIGIPLLLGSSGSSVPITKNLSLTAKHVASYDYSLVVAHHPDCDISIIEKDNTGKQRHKMGVIYPEQKVKTFGKSFMNPLKTIYGEGVYKLDIQMKESMWHNRKCIISVLNSPIQVGMSGGGVFNEKNELVGIINAMGTSDTQLIETGERLGRVSMMTSTNFLRQWINKVVDQYNRDKGIESDNFIH
ncbi:trypsin-like peptidase domain-containing protein [Photobacterium galatheae]|uniref:trypsin-like peptidase domain-containing protein n=1 Tax=Photobacterium galatheae TaxID=1654360 RepID=UPI001376A3F3|nr:trypsin-like peptidase domain-containing protein [Photobacterium galatheae]